MSTKSIIFKEILIKKKQKLIKLCITILKLPLNNVTISTSKLSDSIKLLNIKKRKTLMNG